MPNWSLTLQKSLNRTLFSLLYKVGLVYSVERKKKHLWKYRNYFFKGKVKDFSINDAEKKPLILYNHLTTITLPLRSPVWFVPRRAEPDRKR